MLPIAASVQIQTKKSPLHLLGLFILLSIALSGYLLFSSWHTANAGTAEKEPLPSTFFTPFAVTPTPFAQSPQNE